MSKKVIQKGSLTWLSMHQGGYSRVLDKDSCLEVFNYRSGLVTIAEFQHVVQDNTGLPSLFYYLNNKGEWSLQTTYYVKKD